GVGYGGSVRAMDPATGNYKWEHGTPGPIVPALTYANDLIIDGEGPVIEVLNAKTGERLYSYQTGQDIYGPASVSHGQIFMGSQDGDLYAFGLPNAAMPPSDPQCPKGWACQDVGNPRASGTGTFANGTWSITGSGGGIADISDQVHFVSQPAHGDTQINTE